MSLQANSGVGVAGVDGAALVDAAFRRTSVGMGITDSAGTFLEVNAALCSLLGYTATELTSMSFADITLPEDLPASAAGLRSLSEGQTSEFTMTKRYVTRDGEQRWGRVTATAVRDENHRLLRVIAQIEDLTERRTLDAALRQQESHDELTGLGNRRLFYDRVQAALAHPRLRARGLAVLVVNIDRFSQINAGLGQAAADAILQEVARRLIAATRGQDTVARLGGDEFGVLAVGAAAPEEAAALAAEVWRGLGDTYWASGNPVSVAVRIGVAIVPSGGTEAEALIHWATTAAVEAKALSSGWALHVDGADLASRDELGFVADLRAAIDNGQITVAYQPVVNPDGALHYLEALARWDHPRRGAVPPDQFIVLAEQNRLIGALTTRILTIAVHQTSQWHAMGLPVTVAVNLSGKLLGNIDAIALISRIVRAAGLPPEALTLEITETALAEGSSPVIWTALDQLRRDGSRISIDDFGTGYSSLAYLKRLPVDELKIDRSFVVDLTSDHRTERIVRSIIALAHSLNLSVVAEGVEDDTAAAHLRRLGVDHLQGYGIARPASSRHTTEWLHSHPHTPIAGSRAPHRRRALTVLVVHDALSSRTGLNHRLSEHGHQVVEEPSVTTALQSLADHHPDVIILDHLMPSLTGVDITPLLRQAGYAGPILLFSDLPPADLAAIRLPIDVWPVSKTDEPTLLRLIDGYAASPTTPLTLHEAEEEHTAPQ